MGLDAAESRTSRSISYAAAQGHSMGHAISEKLGTEVPEAASASEPESMVMPESPDITDHFNFCRSLYTALINEYPPPTLINWGKVFTDSVIGIDEYLRRLRSHQYALIMDGFDPNGHHMAVFGADKKCWPKQPDSPAFVNIPIFPEPSEAFTFNRRRWLNSGNMIGPVSVLRHLYDRANHIKSDQLYIAEIFGQQDLNMTVDYQSELFQTMTFSHTNIMFLEDDVFTFPRKSPSQRRMSAVNKISSAVPPVLHFNGPKEAMHEWWPKMWGAREWSERIYRSGGAYTTDAEFLYWHDLCGNADVNEPPEYKDAE
ncbi:hypothetical protein V1517DRAFT_350612 [Lipomyces orientalis]|uniref:Uncharacterized protein n=1 Tax=Lipomyces orientalis TaxID=1233043 RepID=A0ACC3TYM2_9ASCO